MRNLEIAEQESKVVLAAVLLANALEEDKEGKESFTSILAVTVQDELDRMAGEDGSVTLTSKEILAVSRMVAQDFVKTLENQNDDVDL